MTHKARFLCNKYEEKYDLIPYYESFYFKDDGNWHLSDIYDGRAMPAGYKMHNEMLYKRCVDKDIIFHEEDSKRELKKGDKVEVNDQVVTILKAIKNLDGSMDYYTDKELIVEFTTLD